MLRLLLFSLIPFTVPDYHGFGQLFSTMRIAAWTSFANRHIQKAGRIEIESSRQTPYDSRVVISGFKRGLPIGIAGDAISISPEPLVCC